MTIAEALEFLLHYPRSAEVQVYVDGTPLPLTGHTTHGGEGQETVVLFFANTKLHLAMLTDSELGLVTDYRDSNSDVETRA